MLRILILNDIDNFAAEWQLEAVKALRLDNIQQLNKQPLEERRATIEGLYKERPNFFFELPILEGMAEFWERQKRLSDHGYFDIGWLTATGYYPCLHKGREDKRNWILKNLPGSEESLEHFNAVIESKEKAGHMDTLQVMRSYDQIWLLDDFFRTCDEVNNHPNSNISAIWFNGNYDSLLLALEEKLEAVNKNTSL